MEFNVNEIPEEGLDLHEEFNAAAMDMETPIIKFHKPIFVDAHIEREKDDIFADVRIKAAAFEECSRCLATFEAPVLIDKKFLYSARGKTTISMDHDIREEVMLEYPIKPLCAVDCKGLCPRCGKNLNEGECDCNKNIKGWRK